jgi:transposase
VLSPVHLTVEELDLIEQHFHKAKCEEIRLRSHAVVLSHKGYSFSQIGEILFTGEQTIYRWIKAFQVGRISSLFPKTLGNQHAAKLTKAQKQELHDVLAKPPSDHGIPQKFWDISSLKQYIKAEFGVEYESDESYRLIFVLHNYSFHLPATFDRHRDEKKIEKRMEEIKKEIQSFIQDDKWIIFTSDECRIVWESEIRRLWLPKGKKTIIKVERKRQAQSFIGFLNLKTGEDLLYRLSWQKQDTIIPVLEELTKKYPDKRICIIWDNARFHHGKKLKKKLSTTLKKIHLINLPPYAPDHNPQEHVWKYGKEKIANNQRESLEEVVQVFMSAVTARVYNYKF